MNKPLQNEIQTVVEIRFKQRKLLDEIRELVRKGKYDKALKLSEELEKLRELERRIEGW